MITHCPYCDTHFRVHAEQLAARAGQVRCGKCSRIFNALQDLNEELHPIHSLRPSPELDAPHAEFAAANPIPESAATRATSASADAPERASASAEDLLPETTPAGAETPVVAMVEPASRQPTSVETAPASGAGTFDFGPAATSAPGIHAHRWRWFFGALLLLLTLLVQAVYQYRGAITLLFPETKPYATALCANLGCELPLPRRIEMLSIEASDLQADTTNPNVMVLSATIKNRAIFSQQHPLLELTLTDAQDQPVVRRVLAPQDYLAPNVNTQAGFAANAEIAVKVFIEGSQVKATGYRLYLFYS